MKSPPIEAEGLQVGAGQGAPLIPPFSEEETEVQEGQHI